MTRLEPAVTNPHLHVLTERLDLRKTDPVGDLDDLFASALAAASSLDDSVPFIAWIAPHNTPSVKVAERLGLTNYGSRTDPSDGQRRLAWADRSLD
jgi:hypothetical protein